MRKLMLAALVGGQILTAAQPVRAAELGVHEQRQVGAFGGLRLRVRLDGPAREQGLRAGLTLAPTLRTQQADGASRTRFGEGLELGIRQDRPLTLSIGGTPLSHSLGAGQEQPAEEQPAEEPEQRQRTPDERQQETGRKILKGAAVIALVGAAVIGGLFLFITVACDGNRCDE